ncbi:class I SAM-dependent methyltransferase [Actinoplanes sp. NEAU-H7]|uniref:Class I SAM-dependent methyltransferase n=2 Tax=Actinoplanes flavus TaxID=2820290 RepID=A0ABS3V093_9ACTN|nr:class I SAM-dependent methyltransferase [Actinoplanes flavus]
MEGAGMTTELRRVFDEDAERYDRARPGYPPQIFEDLAAAGAPPPARVLEIGPGTGKATVSLAERGYRIIGVELGASLAAAAQRNLAEHPAVTIVTGTFEGWPLPEEPFDVVFAATSFHWIDPATRVSRSADALRIGGLLATVATHHIKGGTEAFFAAAQRLYERHDPRTPPNLRLEPARDIPHDDAEIEASDRFGPAAFHRYEWDATYTTSEYLDLLLTYSTTRSMPRPEQSALLKGIGRLIDEEHGGRIVKRYLSELRLAHRIR